MKSTVHDLDTRLIKKLNKMLEIETKLSIAFYSQTNREDKLRVRTVFKNIH